MRESDERAPDGALPDGALPDGALPDGPGPADSGGATSDPGGRPAPRGPVDASMSLINELLQRPLDPGYAAAARRRDRGERAGPAQRVVIGLLAVALGVLVGVAIANLRVPAAASAQAREELVHRIDAANADAASREARIARLRGEVDALGARAASERGEDPSAAVAVLGIQAGSVPMTGPGLQVTLDDAPDASLADPDQAQRGSAFAQGRIMARDVQAVVNALWESGAEAIAINGQRLTSTSAIRHAGQAILVNYRPLTRPYVITALGPPTLQSRFADGPGGAYLEELSSAYDAVTGTEAFSAQDRRQVPAGPALSLRYARPDGPAGAAETTPNSTGPTPDGKETTS